MKPMKTLKITFLLLAVVLLTVSGQSSETVVDNDEPTYNTEKQYDLMASLKKKRLKQSNG